MSTTKLEWVLAAKDQASGVFDKVGKEIDGTASKFDKFKKGAVIGATAVAGGLAILAKSSIQAGEAASTSNARTLQVLDSMGMYGDEAQKVGDRINTLANATARKTGVDQNQIKAAQSVLLTFSELTSTADEAGGSFDRATQAAIDLAATGFGSAESNAVQLGKALNDPIKGIGALAEAGVTFTEQEKEQIAAMVEAGNTAGAQNKILNALEKQVGGVAVATANSSDKMKVGWSQVSETIGLALLPVFDKFSTVMVSLTGFVTKHQGATMALLGVIAGLAAIILTVSAATKLYALYQAASTAATAIATSTQWAFVASLLANPITLIIVGIAALVAGLVWFFTKTETGQKVWESFSAAMVKGWEWIKGAFAKGYQAVTGYLSMVWDKIKTVWSYSPIGLITGNWGAIMDFFRSVPGKIGDVFRSVGDYITRPFKNAFNGIARMWNNSVGRLSFTVPDIIGVPNRGETFSFPKLPYLAEGGIVSRPTLAVIGEGSEPEAVVPLSKLDAMLNGKQGRGPVTARIASEDIHALGDYIIRNAGITTAQGIERLGQDVNLYGRMGVA